MSVITSMTLFCSKILEPGELDEQSYFSTQFWRIAVYLVHTSELQGFTTGHAFWPAVFETTQNLIGKKQKLSLCSNLFPLSDKATRIPVGVI